MANVRVGGSLLASLPPGVRGPRYDRAALEPGIVHIGVGNFHRAHEVPYVEDAMEASGAFDWAIEGLGILPSDRALQRALAGQDCLYTLLERGNETSQARVVGALLRYQLGPDDPEAAFEALARAAIRIVSLTITEGGYCTEGSSGGLDFAHPGVRHDLTEPARPKTALGYLAEGLERRRLRGFSPVAAVSCDNLAGNGKVLRRALLDFARARSAELAGWIERNVSFPSSMVDRITPVSTEADRELLRSAYGMEDACPVTCEPYRQWVVEDTFAAGRPALERAGVQFTSDVAPYQDTKIRLLNATHSAMGYLGYLCGYRYVHEVATAPEFERYLTSLMDEEVTPLLDPLPGLELDAYKRSILTRFANRSIVDTLLRICSDGSAKIPKFVLPSIADQLARHGPIRRLALCVASWLRFLDGADEQGRPIPLQDPGAERLVVAIRKSKPDPRPALALRDVFGELGSSERFAGELERLLRALYEQGARATLAFAGE